MLQSTTVFSNVSKVTSRARCRCACIRPCAARRTASLSTCKRAALVSAWAPCSQGVLAKKEDLMEVFGTADEEAVCLRILAEGELQARP